MKILIISTSGRDRSRSLVRFMGDKYPKHEFRCCGFNKFYTSVQGTQVISDVLIGWADHIVYAEDVHREMAETMFEIALKGKTFTVLNLQTADMNEYCQLAEPIFDEILNGEVL